MKTVSIFALALVVSGCASQPQGPYDPIAAQCEYEANVATANISNPVLAGGQMGMIYNQCMQIRRNAAAK